jgi:hypothetical protein
MNGAGKAKLNATSGLLFTLLAVFSRGQGAEPGDVEKRYLREAAQGHLENVYMVQMFDGFMAFPRTFVLTSIARDNLSLLTALHPDGSLNSLGSVDSGLILNGPNGTRLDLRTQVSLPSNPVRTERHGALKVEYFEPSRFVRLPKVLITDSSRYLELTGSATIVARELVETYLALTGPPDIFDRRTGQNSKGAGSTSSNSDRATERAPVAEGPPLCDAVVHSAHVYVAEENRLMIRIFPGSDPNVFRQVGFSTRSRAYLQLPRHSHHARAQAPPHFPVSHSFAKVPPIAFIQTPGVLHVRFSV